MTTISITPEVRGFLRGIIGMDDATKTGILQFYANSNSLSFEDLITAAAEVEESSKGKVEKERKKDAKSAQKIKDEQVRGEILACLTLESVRAFLPYVEERKKEIFVTLTGFGTNLRPSRQGNTSGKGRPALDAPTGYLNPDSGEEILGGVTTFVKEQVEEDNFSEEVMEALYTKSGNLRGRDKVIAVLLEADLIEKLEKEDSSDED